ncbi:hypothetical protein LshimejAT787_1002380 [Lyophyllum shimeji]|uniref:Uncharacterized protein n=1 Tax=Lyophyllum shimeji TaxID=47721 RepID=A0A9P3PTA1_LYOSH|nr:hypothetical protein LshimejAT787_1002380 [Lyophyllum shimeji]
MHWALALLALATLVRSQWVFPFALPSDKTIADYTTGRVLTNLNFASGDSLEGAFLVAPVDLYLIIRCSNVSAGNEVAQYLDEEFHSDQGFIAKDGSWVQMPFYLNRDYSQKYPTNATFTGAKGIWVFFDPYLPFVNSTTGPLCWFELSPGVDGTRESSPTNRNCTLTGASDPAHHFVSTPFLLGPERKEGRRQIEWQIGNDGKLAYKWKNGTVSPNWLNGVQTTISFGNRPTATSAGVAAQPVAIKRGWLITAVLAPFMGGLAALLLMAV